MWAAGRVSPTGTDLRVVTAQGKVLASRVLIVGPGDTIRFVFAAPASVSKCHVYFGNPKPKPPAPALQIDRGILMETRTYEGKPYAADKAKQIFQGKGKLLGRMFRSSLFVGHNPFGPQSKIASMFTGYMDLAKAGTYEFVCSCQGKSFLVINDKLVYTSSHVGPATDKFGSVEVELRKGANVIAAAVGQHEGPWQLRIRFRNPDGSLSRVR